MNEARKLGGRSHVVLNEPRKAEPSVGPNSPCSCGSGRKAKKCCAYKTEPDHLIFNPAGLPDHIPIRHANAGIVISQPRPKCLEV